MNCLSVCLCRLGFALLRHLGTNHLFGACVALLVPDSITTAALVAGIPLILSNIMHMPSGTYPAPIPYNVDGITSLTLRGF